MKRFHLGDVLSVTTGLLLSPRHMEGMYEILNYLTGENLFTHQLPRACETCKPWLLKRYPVLASPEIAAEVLALQMVLKTPSGKHDPKTAVEQWLERMTTKYGAFWHIEALPPGQHEQRDPVQDLVEKVGAKKVIVVRG